MFSAIAADGNDNVKNFSLIDAGDNIMFLDTTDSYIITEKTMVGQQIVITLNTTLTVNHYINDVFVVQNKKYEDATNSNIMSDSTTSSSFKIKFVNPADINSKTWAVSRTSHISNTYSTLYNDDYVTISDL